MPTDARAINDMVDIVNVLRNLNFDCTQFNVTIDTAVRVRLKKTQEIPGFPWGAEHPWGLISVVGAVVTIAPGEFDAGNGAALKTDRTSVTIMDDASYIPLEYDPSGSGTLSILPPQTGKPVSGNGVFQTWLYFFKLIGTGDSAQAVYVRHNLTGAHAALFAASAGP